VLRIPHENKERVMAITLPERKPKQRYPTDVPQRAMPAAPQEPAPFDRAYWIDHCHGYRVDAAEGRIGFVEDVIADAGRTVLAVRSGRLGRRTLFISGDEVEFIVPRAERVWLRAPTTILGSEAAPAAGPFTAGRGAT
jgi:hypothetical protein